MHTHAHTHVHTRTHTRAHTHTRTHTHTCTHTRTHTHTHLLTLDCSLSNSCCLEVAVATVLLHATPTHHRQTLHSDCLDALQDVRHEAAASLEKMRQRLCLEDQVGGEERGVVQERLKGVEIGLIQKENSALASSVSCVIGAVEDVEGVHTVRVCSCVCACACLCTYVCTVKFAAIQAECGQQLAEKPAVGLS